MKEFVVNEQTEHVPIGELVSQLGDEGMILFDEAGRIVGWIGLEGGEPFPPMTPEEISELRRLRASDPSTAMTTEELLDRLRARVPQA